MTRRLRTRGQAAVELALGLTLMVTILLFGIHFGEMGYLGAKLHEAAASTMWDSTAYRTHQMTVWGDANNTAVPMANINSARYADFDGRASHVGSAPVMAMTQAEAMTVKCRKTGAYPLPGFVPMGDPGVEPGGITCSATSNFSVINIGTNFANGSSGFFGESQRLRTSSQLCSSGRLTAGTCGEMSMMLGDDGLHDGSEQGECDLGTTGGAPCAGNPDFYGAAKTAFDRSAVANGLSGGYTGAPEAWAKPIVPDVPGNQMTGFFMSFKGSESNFQQTLSNGDVWETNPYLWQYGVGTPYKTSKGLRETCAPGDTYCYLGKFRCD